VIPHLCDEADDFEDCAVAELPGLHALALRLCRDQASAADLVQDTIERALANRDRFTRGTQLSSWLRTIMRNIFADNWRRANVHPQMSLPPESCGTWGPCARDAEPDGGGPGDLEDAARWRYVDDDQLRAALAQLPEPLRLAFELHTAEGLSYAALAQRLGIAVSTVGTRLLRARRRLRATLMRAA
jgi:RNA polymerase sigma-70 factor, ECF subfamily